MQELRSRTDSCMLTLFSLLCCSASQFWLGRWPQQLQSNVTCNLRRTGRFFEHPRARLITVSWKMCLDWTGTWEIHLQPEEKQSLMQKHREWSRAENQWRCITLAPRGTEITTTMMIAATIKDMFLLQIVNRNTYLGFLPLPSIYILCQGTCSSLPPWGQSILTPWCWAWPCGLLCPIVLGWQWQHLSSELMP